MASNRIKSLLYFLQYLPIAALLGLSRLLPFDVCCALTGRIAGFCVCWLPPFRLRVEQGLKRVYPQMPRSERRRIAHQVGYNSGRTLAEILNNSEFATKLARFKADGPGLVVLQRSKQDRKAAMIISGHFGQWEAIRHFLKAGGMETGTLYRPNSNPWYNSHFLSGIKEGGAPILSRGTSGTLQMFRHIRNGGFIAILADQYTQSGEKIPFLGHMTSTTTGPAKLALRYDIPLVPAFGLRTQNRRDIAITFEEPIQPSNPVAMMEEFNARIAAQIHANPEQWYWLHRRWKLPDP